jgi:hypothetical protein
MAEFTDKDEPGTCRNDIIDTATYYHIREILHKSITRHILTI